MQLPTSVSNTGNYFQREDGLFPGIVQIPDHGAACAALGGIEPAPENLREVPPSLCCQRSLWRALRVVHTWTKSLKATPVAVSLVRPLRSRPPLTTNAQAEPSRGFAHAPCAGQGTHKFVLSSFSNKGQEKNNPTLRKTKHT